LRMFCSDYIACDIVPDLIEFNKKKYRTHNVDFRVVDLVTDVLPAGDIVFIRQVLQHLRNSQIKQLIPKLVQNYKILILTEHLASSNAFAPMNQTQAMRLR